ncbi:uncharacterized protein B0H18DRAFT_689897 [Fomitopsis serialis]|uniref:uncharacterized protein n=1 Tax=Fomitopsis serialis TaxID=139415 RepID=UPI002008A1CB|nr:uncharacterized protein B0H18DRAFT_689897 [Neoantrodia serialis]KAH9917748.1 hypothetical protein B0H18DRAFT_689897 [Neoantrodia serialis]
MAPPKACLIAAMACLQGTVTEPTRGIVIAWFQASRHAYLVNRARTPTRHIHTQVRCVHVPSRFTALTLKAKGLSTFNPTSTHAIYGKASGARR